MLDINSTIIIKTLKTLQKEPSVTMLSTFREEKRDPFYMLISTILSARAKDETTIPIAEILLKKYPTPAKLAKAKQKDVQKIIRKIGFFRTKSRMVIECSKQLLDRFNGVVPESTEDLISLPGVGRKVAGCVRVYAFGLPSIPVDTHVHRISNRLGWVDTNSPEKTELQLMEKVPKKYWQLVNDLLVHHGKTVCKPITPLCKECKISRHCPSNRYK